MFSWMGFVGVVRAVQRDGWLMTIVATFVVLLILFIDLRSFKTTMLVFIPLAVGLCWTAGLMALFHIKIGLYNMLVLPTLLGVGIDASVHFYHAYKEHGPGSLKHVFGTTGVAIIIAAATTAVGFTGMLVVAHNGLKSIGILAVLGIIACLAGALITLPLLAPAVAAGARISRTSPFSVPRVRSRPVPIPSRWPATCCSPASCHATRSSR